MSDNIFASAVIRELENDLLSFDDTVRMIEEKSREDIIIELSGSSGNRTKNEDELIKKERLSAWETVDSLAHDSTEIKSLTVINDFHNLKVALKSIFAGETLERLYMYPTTVDTSSLFEIIRDRKYYELPKDLQAPTERAYSVLSETKDGQTLDTFLDREALEALRRDAKKSKSEMFKRFTEFFITATNIKTAYRGAKVQKSEKFFISAFCESETLDSVLLASAASKGEGQLLDFISSSAYDKAAEKLKVSITEFERYFDDELTKITQAAQLEAFSVDPCFAYYNAMITQLKNIKLILTCKKHGVPQKNIRERLRMTYV